MRLCTRKNFFYAVFCEFLTLSFCEFLTLYTGAPFAPFLRRCFRAGYFPAVVAFVRFRRVFCVRVGCFAFAVGVAVCVVACFSLSFCLFSCVVASVVEFIDGGRVVRFRRVLRVILKKQYGRRNNGRAVRVFLPAGRVARGCGLPSVRRWKRTGKQKKNAGGMFYRSRPVVRSSYVVLMRPRFLACPSV